MNISEVSKKYDIPVDTIRYYEKIGLIPNVNRKQSGIRDFSEIDIKWVEYIKCMRSAGMPVKELSEYVGLFKEGSKTHKQRKQILIKQRDDLSIRLKEMKKTLKILDHKIDTYDTEMKEYEKKLKK